MQIFNYFTFPEKKPSTLNGREIKLSPDFNIHSKLQGLFNQIKPNSTVRATSYMWGQETPLEWQQITGNPFDLTQTFIAKTKNTDVKIILDGFNTRFSPNTVNLLAKSISTKLTPMLNKSDPIFRKRSASSFVFRFNNKNKDERNIGYMHDKFFLFSELDIGKHVVVCTSANLNLRQYLQFNSMTVLVEAEEIYNNYLNYWNSLNKEKYFKCDNPVVFPREFCPIATKLRQILVANDKKEICLAMCYFTRRIIADLLLELKKQGCSIKIILSQEYANKKIVDYLRGRINLKIIRNRDWIGKMHNKFMLVDNTVYIGSYNLTKPALYENNESLLIIEDKNCYKEYHDYFQKLLTIKQLFR